MSMRFLDDVLKIALAGEELKLSAILSAAQGLKPELHYHLN